MIFIDINVANDQQDCFIIASDDEVLYDVTIANTPDDFNDLFVKIKSVLEKKRSEGKHYNVAVSHAAKKLIRLILLWKNLIFLTDLLHN